MISQFAATAQTSCCSRPVVPARRQSTFARVPSQIMAVSAAKTVDPVEGAPQKKMSRAERRHGAKYRPVEEPTIQIPKGAIIAAVVVLVLAAIMGIKTSLQAASNSKPFSMEGFEKKGEKEGVDEVDPDPRDTKDSDFPNGDWLEDPIMAKSMMASKCDLDRVHYLNMTTKRFAREYDGVKPVIIEGLVGDKWPARSAGRWARPSLMDSFGLSPIHVSSGAGVVHSGGESLRTVTLTDFLEGLRENDGSGASASAFTFDLEFVDSNKELKKDFKVPTIFRGFNSHESMRRGGSWNILSLGASGAGLPFHAHGETWLGVVYGAKRWALYPPSIPRPYGAEKVAGWHPLMGSLEWFKDVQPMIKKTGEAAPLECMQNPGDLIYVPANWGHMTLNVGESIGVGGQALYTGEVRLQDGLDLLLKMPNDPEVLHSVGVGLAHRGIDALNRGDDPMAAKDGDIDFESRLNLLRAGMPLTASQLLNTAAESLKKAMMDRPGYPETHIILAETLAKGSRIDEAEEVIEKAWKQFSRDELPEGIPDSTLVVVQLNLARFFLQTEDGAKAEAYLKAGPLALQPEHGDALADLAVALAMQGQDRLQEAVETIGQAEELGAAGESFSRRRGFVMRLVMQTAQHMASEKVAADLAQEESEESEDGVEVKESDEDTREA